MRWIDIPSEKRTYVAEEEKISVCQIELNLSYSDLNTVEPDGYALRRAPLRIMSVDIETDVPSNFSLPRPTTQQILQIASMATRHGDEEPFSRCVMLVGSCREIEGIKIVSYETEKAMLEAWFDHFQELDPDVLTGYNTSRFDLPYIFIRAEQLGIKFDLGRLKGTLSIDLMVTSSLWSHLLLRAAAGPGVRYKGVNFQQRDFSIAPLIPGILNFDVLNHIYERHPMSDSEQHDFRQATGRKPFGLDGSSWRFLGEKKEDIDFRLIPTLQRGTDEDRTRLAVYCSKDAWLPLRLIHKLNALESWIQHSRRRSVSFNISFMRPRVADLVLSIQKARSSAS
ncbi:DNA-directed DNA polymerase delta [Marasmius sp. AFHP31]|nr:DNA-directed DNA polymerase delta [Marasmius sp. AFHP31]